MPLAPTETRAFSYRVTVAPAVLPVELDDLKLWLKITGNASDDLLNLMLESATEYAEQATGRWFITRTAETYRELFPSVCNAEGYYRELPAWEIKRSPLQSIEKITYFSEGSQLEVDPSVYYNTTETAFSKVLARQGSAGFPGLDEARLQNITIEFKAGYGDTPTEVPSWAKTAISSHVMAMWANRGDCMCGDSGGVFLPAAAEAVYRQNKIINI